MTIISIIAAMSENRVIGYKNSLPWSIPEELQHFKKVTMGKTMIMGRKTFDSINRRLLPGRKTIILTTNEGETGTEYEVANNIEQAIELAGDVEEIMIVGGANIYREFLPLANKIYLSIINGNYEGDTYFPEINYDEWNIIDKSKFERYETLVLEKKF